MYRITMRSQNEARKLKRCYGVKHSHFVRWQDATGTWHTHGFHSKRAAGAFQRTMNALVGVEHTDYGNLYDGFLEHVAIGTVIDGACEMSCAT